jgi:hypothetical protein
MTSIGPSTATLVLNPEVDTVVVVVVVVVVVGMEHPLVVDTEGDTALPPEEAPP